MKSTLTAKLNLVTTPDQFRALRATQLAYRDALNHASAYSFAHGKTSNGKRLQRATSTDLRRQFGLPAQMACNVPRQVGSTYRALWTRARKHAEARRLGYTKRRARGLDQAPHYGSPTLTDTLGRDYSLRAGPEVSLLTLTGRLHVSYQGWSRHVALLQEGATSGGARLW
jgi:putative transposase